MLELADQQGYATLAPKAPPAFKFVALADNIDVEEIKAMHCTGTEFPDRSIPDEKEEVTKPHGEYERNSFAPIFIRPVEDVPSRACLLM